LHRTIKLPPDSHDFVLSRVECGRYENAGEVMRAALLALHREETASEQRRNRRSIAEEDVFRKLWEASGPAMPPDRRRVERPVFQQ
jgi:putative addiction module CopG family antidote